jgi:LysM repeat protein
MAGLAMAGVVNTAVAADQPATSIVVVQSGESLWSIAQSIKPGADPRAVVHEIKSLNGLTDAVVRVGQPLVVPASS